MTKGIWIEGFLRSSNNESMQQNCKSFDSDISIQVTKTQENVDIFCLYYNLTDGVLYTDICENPKAFLCESSTNGKPFQRQLHLNYFIKCNYRFIQFKK